ncbi:MAG: HAMP domain-containing protein [Nannocystis sp.]|nr:HAMP domain-containing protein [Nannocystis sp.]
MTAAAPPPRGLFRRIYLTFVATVALFALLSGVFVFSIAGRFDAAWVATIDELLSERSDALITAIDDPPARERLLAALAGELDVQIALHDPQGRLLAGADLPPPSRRPRRRARLRDGQPIVVHRDRAPPLLHFGLQDPARDQLVATLTLSPRDRRAWHLLGLGLGGFLTLGLGALPLARSLVRRLAALDASAQRIARGQLDHRLPLPPGGPADEVDALALSFNHMAERVEELIAGQRRLLANVSHELRTPVARMRVLIELLSERLERLLDERAAGEDPAAKRLRAGLGELAEDIREVEVLISDLLIGGKLELSRDIDRAPVDLHALLQRLAERSRAALIAPAQLQISGDALLLERLFSNLLSNARRACPSGQITIQADPRPDHLLLTVDDEGPGIDPADRDAIFDPFVRLDAARDRDRGGVGLGLHLCRQIARAHGGTITAEDRPQGRGGARLALRLPLP